MHRPLDPSSMILSKKPTSSYPHSGNEAGIISSANPLEISRFEEVCHLWWDQNGPFKPLHDLNPARLEFIFSHLRLCFPDHVQRSVEKPLEGLNILDIGCGGGLICEPLCRLGAHITGIDASPQTIDVAAAHAQSMGLSITYLCTDAKDLANQGYTFDAVIALEVVEHVNDPASFLKTCADLTKPGGGLFLSTLNRTWKAWILGIVTAEYILGWIPKGTHDWYKFISPATLMEFIRPWGLVPRSLMGLVYNPLRKTWSLSPTDLDINYMAYAEKAAHPL